MCVTSPDSSSVPSLPWAVARISPACPEARSALVVPWVTLCWKTAPSPAIPVAMPTWRKVELIPDAIPLRSSGTTPIAVDASGGLTRPTPAPAAVRYDIGQQHAGVISNVGRDQYNAYVQQRESFLREVAATKSKARVLAWLGFLLVVLGFTMYGASILRFIGQVQVADENTHPQDIQLLGPTGILGLGLGLLGSVLLIVGIVLHIVASARRRRVDRDMPPTFPQRPY